MVELDEYDETQDYAIKSFENHFEQQQQQVELSQAISQIAAMDSTAYNTQLEVQNYIKEEDYDENKEYYEKLGEYRLEAIDNAVIGTQQQALTGLLESAGYSKNEAKAAGMLIGGEGDWREGRTVEVAPVMGGAEKPLWRSGPDHCLC